MLLKVKGFKIPKGLSTTPFLPIEDIKADDEWAWMKRKPKHLIPLKDSSWPEEVKLEIVRYFKEIGIENPLECKLVEPHAVEFGGMPEDGEYNLKKVNWQRLKEWFKYEALTYAGKDDECRKIQEKVKKKYGHIFRHEIVYTYGGW